MKKFVFFALGLVLTFSACSDFAAVGDLDKVVSDLDSLNQRLTDLETRVGILEDIDISNAVLEIEKIQGQLAVNTTSIDALQDQLTALEDELDSNTGSGDASTVFWGDVKTDEQYTELVDGKYTKVTGTVYVTSSAQVLLLQDIEYIGADLNISEVVGVTAFAALENISGSINIGSISDNASLDFSSLQFVNGNINTSLAADSLASLSLPVLKMVMGDLSLNFSEDGSSFKELNIAELSLVGGDFDIVNTSLLATIDFPTVYIGGTYTLSGNKQLSLGASHFSDMEYVGGAIYIGSNYEDYASVDEENLADIFLFDNLSYIGESISLFASPDMYKIFGFSQLQSIPGDLFYQSRCLSFGNDEYPIFESLTSIGGELTVTISDPFTLRTEDSDVKPHVFGFQNLLTVGTNFKVGADWVYGFENLVSAATTSTRYDNANFSISGEIIPTFSSFISMANIDAELIISTTSTKIDHIFPVMTQDISGGDIVTIRIILDLLNTTEIQTFNGGFESLTKLAAFNSTYSFGCSFENGFLSQLTSITQESTNELNIEVNLDSELLTLAEFFKAKAADKIYADSAWISDNATYELMEQYFEAGTIDQDELDGYIPYRKDQMTDSINIYQKESVDNMRVTTNFYEVKLDESDPRPAYIQCFKYFGDLTDEELGYTLED